MLHVIQDLSDDFLALIKDDPVRPEIPAEQRVNANSKIFVLKDDNDQPLAVTCVKFLETIPKTVDDLAIPSQEWCRSFPRKRNHRELSL